MWEQHGRELRLNGKGFQAKDLLDGKWVTFADATGTMIKGGRRQLRGGRLEVPEQRPALLPPKSIQGGAK